MSDEKKPSEEENVPPPPPQSSAPPPPPPQSSAPQPPWAGSAPAGDSNRTVMLVLAYFGIFALIPFLMEKDNKEIQWHSKHGLVLLGAEIVLFIGLFIIGLMPLIGQIIGCLISIAAPLGILILHIVAILKALKGERLLIPGLSDFADKF